LLSCGKNRLFTKQNQLKPILKKLICFIAAGVMLASCSPDDSSSSSSPATPGLLKKTIETDENGHSQTNNYFYDGNKITRIEYSSGVHTHFTYSGDKITKMQSSYYGENDQIHLIADKNLYAYNASGQLVTFQRLTSDMDIGTKETFVYNSDGTIEASFFHGTVSSQTIPDGNAVFYFTDGEITSITGFLNWTFTYDDKNNPNKEVLGLGQVLAFSSFFGASAINRNMLTSNSTDYATTYSYMYNAEGFPQTSTRSYMGEVSTIEYFYY
jgi:hypothetical protein